MHFPEKNSGVIDKVYDRYGSKVDVRIIAVKHKPVETHSWHFVGKKKFLNYEIKIFILCWDWCVFIWVPTFITLAINNFINTLQNL